MPADISTGISRMARAGPVGDHQHVDIGEVRREEVPA